MKLVLPSRSYVVGDCKLRLFMPPLMAPSCSVQACASDESLLSSMQACASNETVVSKRTSKAVQGSSRKKTCRSSKSSARKCSETELKKAMTKRRPWTVEELNAVKKQLRESLATNQVPQKHQAEQAKANEPIILKDRSWKDIKFCVYNMVQKTRPLVL